MENRDNQKIKIIKRTTKKRDAVGLKAFVNVC